MRTTDFIRRILIALLIATIFLAGIQLRRWIGDTTRHVRYQHDIVNGFYWGSEVVKQARRLSPDEAAANSWPGFCRGYFALYDRVKHNAYEHDYGLDYPPLRLLVMAIWAKQVRNSFPGVDDGHDRLLEQLVVARRHAAVEPQAEGEVVGKRDQRPVDQELQQRMAVDGVGRRGQASAHAGILGGLALGGTHEGRLAGCAQSPPAGPQSSPANTPGARIRSRGFISIVLAFLTALDCAAYARRMRRCEGTIPAGCALALPAPRFRQTE